MNDIFDKIITREIPAEIVYEDESVIAFLSIQPINHGHTLVVPKKKFVNIFDGDSVILGHMMQVGQKIARVLKNELGADGVNILMNNEASAGQEVFHAHLHVIPRMSGDGAYHPAKHVTYGEGEMKHVGEQIKVALS